jgi:predicted metal-dependent HD superfamily phosphohydrolase
MALKTMYFSLLEPYTQDIGLVESFWQELILQYGGAGRFYHTLAHLEHLYGQVLPLRPLVQDWDTFLFTLFYHDIIYNALRKDNEEKSAEIAEAHLSALGYPPARISRCKAQIIATKSHVESSEQDTNLFLDADLSILGQEFSIYTTYTQQIRKEYAMYPDLLYRPGRKKVLQHFLGMDSIFKTRYFQEKYEASARKNLQAELAQL